MSTTQAADSSSDPKKGRFEPKTPVQLNPPKSDPISLEHLAKCDGQNTEYPTYVAIKGRVYDVTGNKAYGPEGPYKMFAGHDASRALGMTSTKPEDVRGEWRDLGETEKKTLEDWVVFFGKRYNIVGVVEGADNLE